MCHILTSEKPYDYMAIQGHKQMLLDGGREGGMTVAQPTCTYSG